MTLLVPIIRGLYVNYNINSHVKMIWIRNGEKIQNLHKIHDYWIIRQVVYLCGKSVSIPTVSFVDTIASYLRQVPQVPEQKYVPGNSYYIFSNVLNFKRREKNNRSTYVLRNSIPSVRGPVQSMSFVLKFFFTAEQLYDLQQVLMINPKSMSN